MNCVNQSSLGLLISNGNILIITIYVVRHAMQSWRTTNKLFSIFFWIDRRKRMFYIQWEKFHSFFNRSRMTQTIQSLHNCRWLEPYEAPGDRQPLHFTSRSPSATNLACRKPPYPGLARFFLSSSSSKYLCSTFSGSFLLRRLTLKNSYTKWQSPWIIIE